MCVPSWSRRPPPWPCPAARWSVFLRCAFAGSLLLSSCGRCGCPLAVGWSHVAKREAPRRAAATSEASVAACCVDRNAKRACDSGADRLFVIPTPPIFRHLPSVSAKTEPPVTTDSGSERLHIDDKRTAIEHHRHLYDWILWLTSGPAIHPHAVLQSSFSTRRMARAKGPRQDKNRRFASASRLEGEERGGATSILANPVKPLGRKVR